MKLLPFLIRAKKATYAGKGAETSSTRPQSHDLIYQEDDYMYYDITKVVKYRRFYLPKFLSAALLSIAVALATAQSSALQIKIYSA